MIEFALVLPILLFLLLGIVDFGRAMNYWNNTNQIAADAARFAAVNRNPGEDLAIPIEFREWVRRQAETRELATGTLNETEESPTTRGNVMRVCVDVEAPYGRNVGDPIRVRVIQKFYLIPFVGSRSGFDNEDHTDREGRSFWPVLDISGEAVMRLEQEYTGPGGCDPP